MKIIIGLVLVVLRQIFAHEKEETSSLLDTCIKASNAVGKRINNGGFWDQYWSRDIVDYYNSFLIDAGKAAEGRINLGYGNLMAKYSNNQTIFSALVDHQKLVRANVDAIVKEEVTMLQQRLQRLQSLSEDNDQFEEAIKKLQKLNENYKQQCESYDSNFVGFESYHMDLQANLEALNNEQLIVKRLSGRSQIHPVDFSLDASTEVIFNGMKSDVPLENLKSGWEQLGQKFNDKLTEADGLVKAEEQAARARIAAKTGLTDAERKVAIQNVENAMNEFNASMKIRKEGFAAAQQANVEEFVEAVKKDKTAASDLYNPVKMEDSRLAYVSTGFFANLVTSDALYTLEHTLHFKGAAENAAEIDGKRGEEKVEHKEESGVEEPKSNEEEQKPIEEEPKPIEEEKKPIEEVKDIPKEHVEVDEGSNEESTSAPAEETKAETSAPDAESTQGAEKGESHAE